MIDYKKVDLNNIENSYEFIIKNLNKDYSDRMLDYLLEKGIDLDKLFSYLEKNAIKVNYNGVVGKLIELKQINLIQKHFDYFWKNNHHLLEFKHIVKDLHFNLDSVNNFIRKNLDLIVEEVTNYSISTLKLERLYDFFKELIKELKDKEKIDYSDIEFIGQGTSSKVFGIGSKVLKVGVPKEIFKMKNNKLFLQPLYRKEIRSIYNNKLLMCIEITEKVDTTNITEDDVYQVYKQLRDEGLVWLDHTVDNVGRLLKDNKIYFDGVDYVDKESTDYKNDNYVMLPKGSLILLDNDCIYDEKEIFKITDYRMFEHCSIYEARYREEQKQKRNRGML